MRSREQTKCQSNMKVAFMYMQTNIRYQILVNVRTWQNCTHTCTQAWVGLRGASANHIHTHSFKSQKVNFDGYSQRQRQGAQLGFSQPFLLTSHWQTFQYYFLQKRVLMTWYMVYLAANTRWITNQLYLHFVCFFIDVMMIGNR